MSDESTLALRLRSALDRRWLFLSWHQRTARVCIGENPERGEASEMFPFAKLVASKLKEQVLIGVTMPVPFERVVQLDFALRLSEQPAFHLLCEVQGRYSNVILTDAHRRIILAARQIGDQQSSLRTLRVGDTYAFPPRAQGLTPAPEPLRVWRSNIEQAAELAASSHAKPGVVSGLVRAYQGMSSSLARELCARAGVEGSCAPNELSDSQWGALHEGWTDWVNRVASGRYAATRDPETGAVSVLGSYAEPCDSVHGAVDELYRIAQARHRFTALHSTLQRSTRTASQKLTGKLAAFDKQMRSSEDSEETQKQADLIMANVYRWPAGAATLEVEDWDTGQSLELRLKVPEDGPVANAEAMYKRSAKQRRAKEQLQPLIDTTRKQLDYVAEVVESLHSLDRMQDFEDLRALQLVQDEMVEQGLMKAPTDSSMAAKGRQRAEKVAKKRGGSEQDRKFRRFEAPSGLEILIGRNNRQNDEISTKIAKENDVWMHARGVPGSHLIIRVPPGADVTNEDIQFAADLSAYYSRARESGRCDVVVTEGKQVKKPKGAKPGQVVVLQETVVMGVPSNSAAANLDSTPA